ncbi:MAG: hypothetical protein J1F10_05315 [Muribaculaceae bacterium]|nr:hypothetical protein [Muribaculaceae bacterium]
MKFSKLLYILGASAMILGSAACSEEKLDPNSIFGDVNDELNKDAYTYKFDKWLEREYRLKYNLDFRYRMEDVGSNLDYNLVPASYQDALDLAILSKYLWFDVYAKMAGDPEFLQKYGPRIIHVIGSPAFNPTFGTMVLGTAEGGIKITLYRVNYLDPTSPEQLNNYYFKTMHHEFGHILHQQKFYPNEFRLVSKDYEADTWQDKNFAQSLSMGHFSPYSTSGISEDWVECIANYIVRSDEWLEKAYWIAEHDWYEEDASSGKKISHAYYYYKTDADQRNDGVDGNNTKTYFVTIDGSKGDTEDFNIEGYNELIVNDDGTYTHSSSRRPAYRVGGDGELDGVKGHEILEHKLNMVRTWFKDKWDIDFDGLRAEVQERQKHIDIDALRAQIENIEE